MLFFDGVFDSPLSRGEGGDYSQALMVRMAPSASNGQPWRLVIDEDAVRFYHGGKEYSVFQQLDIGIAFCHFELAMEELGVTGFWSKESGYDSNYVATWRRK